MSKRNQKNTDSCSAVNPCRKLHLVYALLCGLQLLHPCLSRAGNETESTASVTAPVVDFAQTTTLAITLLKVFGALIFVVGLMVFFSFWLRKLGLSRAGLRQGSLIEVIDTRMIAPKKYVSVVQVGNEVLALGITDHQITKLASLDETHIASAKKVEPRQPSSFSSLLGRAMKKGGA